MKKQNSDLKTAFISEAGAELKNSDYFAFVELDNYACYVIADGIDDKADSVSAKLAIETILSTFMQAPSMRKGTLKNCMIQANKALVYARSKMKLKASVTMVVTDYAKLRYAQAGNTRLQLHRDGTLKEKSQDTSLSMNLVLQDELEQDKVAQHEERNNLYCYIGQDSNFHPVISKKIKLNNGDIVSLFTRGIWENIDDGELEDSFSEASDEPKETLDGLEDMLLSRQPKNLENYTLAVIFINKIYNNPNKRQKLKKALMVALPIVMVLITLSTVLIVLHVKKVKNIREMNTHFSNAIEYIQDDNFLRAKEECAKAQQLADQVKNKEMQSETSNYMKLIESVNLADDQLKNEKYKDAQLQYKNAKDRSRYADNLAADYIDTKLALTSDYLSVYDYLSLGDTLAKNLNYDKAEEKYMDAKALASKIYFDKGKDDAMAALEKLYEDSKKQQEQDEKDTKDKASAQTSAADVLKQGDVAYAQADYDSAKASYTQALKNYEDLQDEEQVKVVQEKLNLLQKKSKEKTKKLSQAENYMNQAEKNHSQGNEMQAKKFYLFAKDIYAEMKEDDKVQEVNRRMELVDLSIAEKEQKIKA